MKPSLHNRFLVVAVAVAMAVVPSLSGSAQPASGSGDDVVALPAPRIAGPGREATSAALLSLAREHGASAPVVVIAPAGAPAVALAASGLAGVLRAGVAVSGTEPPAGLRAAVDAVGAAEVIVVGGDPALASTWSAPGRTVTRVGGGDAVSVAASVAQELGSRAPSPPGRALLVGIGGLPDAVAAAAWSYEAGIPLLLTDSAALSPQAADALDALDIPEVVVLGGAAAVGQPVLESLRRSGIAVRRVAGATRGETALAVAEARGAGLSHVVLAAAPAAAGPVDAAAVGPYAGVVGAAVLPPGPEARAALAAGCGTGVVLQVVGGSAAVPAAEEFAHRAAAERCDGPGRPLTLRVAVAAPAEDGVGEAVAGILADPRGWASRRIRIEPVGVGHSLGLLVVADACGGAVMCRTGRDIAIDAAAWRAAPPDQRSAMVSLAVAHRLGVAPDGSCGTGRGVPLGCAIAAGPWPAPEEVEALADAYIPEATLAFAGDIHAERHIATSVRAGGNPLAPVAPLLQAADIAVVNLETPLSTRGSPVPKTFTFRGPPEMAARLADAGVDVANLANNHGLDYGTVAMLDTLDHAAAAGVSIVGAGRDAVAAYAPVLRDTPAGRVAVIGLTRVLHTRTWEAGPGRPGLASAYDEAAAVAAVHAAAAQADHVVVAVHWGTERAVCPDAAQRHLATLLTDAGADVVVGHHPHVLQGVQVRSGQLIAYSMGNFVWYHNSAPSRYTGVLEVDLPLLDAPGWRFTPAEIGGDGSPHLAGGSLGAAISGMVADRSPGGAAGCAFPG